MKILIFNTLYHPYILGGAEKSTQILAEELVEKGFDVVVVSTGKKDKEDMVNGVKVYYVYITNIFWRFEASNQNIFKRSIWRLIDFYNFSTKDKIGKILSAEKPDVCHTNNIAGFSVSLWDSIKKLGVPLVHTIRDYYSICATSKMLKNDQSCDKQCLECEMYTYNKKINSHKVDAVIGVSKFILDAHVENGYFNKAKMQTYIYNPIEKIKENFIKDKNQELVFGYFGLISSIKGVELLLSSFQKIKNKNIKLVLAGNENDPNYINGLKGKYSDDRIKFIGFVKPEEFFKEVDILIHPSLWNEPFGRVVAEGYAYGIPVIASLKGGLPEIVDDNKTGFLFKSDIELINHINYFIENRSVIEDMKENCIEKANSLLVSDIVDQYINVYRKIL